ncbi:hypothetical protein CC86DRAFT_389553 [Ophiobolus disseminans]|uniref:Fungal N-terminal domain-containing protein n=1 Tax=Ophiobolus disseminans TaxID=1469910 RepID=A0A6A7AIW1_9PLEO|nr:hypothetical protein CC86DRAFT_389553 [Ophiobolus disseminans]
MSFGFAVGDFVAVGTLICEIIDSLQSVGGARSEYQELIRELTSLPSSSTVVESIKFAALSCRVPFEDFLAKAKKYEKSLGPWSRTNVVQAATDKLKWTFGRKDDIRRLQTYLDMHVGTINILLAKHGLERMTLNDSNAETRTSQIRAQLEDTQSVLEGIKKDLPAQALVIRSMHSMLGGLYKLHFCHTINRVCVSTQQIYTVVLEIRDNMMGPDTRWTYAQAAFRVEDALGFQFPVPSEYGYDMLITIIQHRFQEGTGSRDVRAGNFELCKTKRSSELVTAGTRLTPGTAITMAIIVFTARASNAECSMPGCGCLKATPCPGDAFIWYVTRK